LGNCGVRRCYKIYEKIKKKSMIWQERMIIQIFYVTDDQKKFVDFVGYTDRSIIT